MIICKLSILKALPDTESAICLSLVIVFPPFIALYLRVCFEAIFTISFNKNAQNAFYIILISNGIVAMIIELNRGTSANSHPLQ